MTRLRYLLPAVSLVATPALADELTFKPLLDTRLRWEDVVQDGLAQIRSDAVTARVRSGEQVGTGPFAVLVEGEGTLGIDNDYYDGLHGTATRPLVADPQDIALYRAQLQYHNKYLTLTGGRQRIALDDERFVGAVNFRDNGQTFDAVRAEITPDKHIKADVTYAWSVRTIWGLNGTGTRPSSIHGDNVFANLSYRIKPLTLTGFAYLVDQNSFFVQGYKLASKTFGGRAAGTIPFTKRFSLSYQASYAHQNNYDTNPNRYGADYGLIDGVFDYRGFKAGAGYEVLGASSGVALTSFQTPLATGFKFQGWADKFLATPPDGVRDLYGDVAYGWKSLGPLKAVTLQAWYHRFDSDRNVRHCGNEVNLLASARVRKVTVSLRYADYHHDQLFTDTHKAWLQLDWAI